ncbi:hypothetical protein [Pseudomonas chlororaphis]|nr:hypothetical protein [Pseudomonas chlororaphis]
MSAETLARSPSGVTWGGINWVDVQRQVFATSTSESVNSEEKR